MGGNEPALHSFRVRKALRRFAWAGDRPGGPLVAFIFFTCWSVLGIRWHAAKSRQKHGRLLWEGRNPQHRCILRGYTWKSIYSACFSWGCSFGVYALVKGM